MSKPLELRALRIDKSCYCRFKYCARVRNYFWEKWTEQCEYIEFTDKEKIKECADKDMVLKARLKP